WASLWFLTAWAKTHSCLLWTRSSAAVCWCAWGPPPEKSLRLTPRSWPAKAELVGELFGHVAAGRIRIEINQRYALEDAVQAHRDLEGRKTTGSSIFAV